jgi:hypothetical protein
VAAAPARRCTRTRAPTSGACVSSGRASGAEPAPTSPTSQVVVRSEKNTFGMTMKPHRINNVTTVEMRKDRSRVRSVSSRRATRRIPSIVVMAAPPA